jgi:hypothetical protein
LNTRLIIKVRIAWNIAMKREVIEESEQLAVIVKEEKNKW